MDALTFLKTILPEDGYKFVGLSRAGNPGIAHKAYESLELMAEAIASYDKQTNLTVYHACAAYKEPSYEAIVNGETKKKYRESSWARKACLVITFYEFSYLLKQLLHIILEHDTGDHHVSLSS